MPDRFAVIEIDLTNDDFRHNHLHVLWLPSVNEPGFYRQRVSYDAFFHGMPKKGKKHGPHWKPGECLYSAHHWEEFEADCQRLVNFGAERGLDLRDDRKLPMTEYESIWEFYIAIDYDYKRKRWVEDEDLKNLCKVF